MAVPPFASLRAGGAGGRDLGLDEGTFPPSSYVSLERTWKTGDVVDLTIPKALRLESTPDDSAVAAIMWGPLVLAGDLGPRRQKAEPAARVAAALVAGGRPVEEWVLPLAGRAGHLHAAGVARRLAIPNEAPSDRSLAPFYRTHGRTYTCISDVRTSPQCAAPRAVTA